LDCDFTDRIELGVETDDEELRQALLAHKDWIMSETLAVRFDFGRMGDANPTEMKLGNSSLTVYLKRVPATTPGSSQ